MTNLQTREDRLLKVVVAAKLHREKAMDWAQCWGEHWGDGKCVNERAELDKADYYLALALSKLEAGDLEEPPYDSTQDTLDHIERVRELIFDEVAELMRRAEVHDASKLESPEKEIFDRVTPLLKNSTYGSDEYKANLASMKSALDHHYANNSHHPEAYPNGIADMDILDILEMTNDWKAATERHANGSYVKSLEINKERFGIDDQLYSILWNSARNRGWV